MNTKLIIVCDENTQKYGNYLRQLVSLKDDEKENVVGIEDGSVQCIVWNETDYLNNSKKISSNEHVLFIGNNKTTLEEKAGIRYSFDKYDMKYGWLGKRAILLVDGDRDNKKDYDDFCSYCESRNFNLDKIKLSEKIHSKNRNKLKKTLNKVFNKVLDVKNVASTKIFSHKDIVNQKYLILIKVFYYDSLNDFLGE